jgi:hypothetical protein
MFDNEFGGPILCALVIHAIIIVNVILGNTR